MNSRKLPRLSSGSKLGESPVDRVWLVFATRKIVSTSSYRLMRQVLTGVRLTGSRSRNPWSAGYGLSRKSGSKGSAPHQLLLGRAPVIWPESVTLCLLAHRKRSYGRTKHHEKS